MLVVSPRFLDYPKMVCGVGGGVNKVWRRGEGREEVEDGLLIIHY